MKKERNIYGIKNNEKFNIRFTFDDKEDYLERFCEELEEKNNVKLENVTRLYIQDANNL